jgi:hypothetical protein
MAEYDPAIRCERINDKWFGLDTPDGSCRETQFAVATTDRGHDLELG